jgi:regulatory protein SWI6
MKMGNTKAHGGYKRLKVMYMHWLTLSRIPLQRGQELAAQYGVSDYLSPIFDFIPAGATATALPISRQPSIDSQSGTASYPTYRPMGYAGPPQVDPHFQAYQYQGQYNPQQAHPAGMWQDRKHGLAPAPTIEAMGLPQGRSNVYIDQYGQPHPTFQAQQYVMDGGDLAPPAKRQRSDEGYTNNLEEQQVEEEPMENEEEDTESADEIPDAPPLPTAMRLANKPLRPKPNALAARTRGKMLGLFAQSSSKDLDLRSELGVEPDSEVLEFDIDMVIDSQGHTALHWAASLARTDIVIQLLELGADIHRGNYAGETPLIRAVLTTNHAESGSFSQLLEHLSPSIRTLDQAYRSVIHHISLVAGIKGRAPSAQTYMGVILEWVAKGNMGSVGIKNLVDLQDVHGDTALNVAARVGNRGLVKLLLDTGADRARANKLGLKPADFGVEVEVSCGFG